MNDDLLRKIKQCENECHYNNIDEKVAYSGKFIEVVHGTYKFPNNKIVTQEKIISNNGKEAVIIVPITKEGKIILTIQPRPAFDKKIAIEFPSGFVEENEDVIGASSRELKEETGYEAIQYKYLDSYYTSLGITNSKVHIVLATECYKKSSQTVSDNEFIRFIDCYSTDLDTLVSEHYIEGVGNKFAYYYLKYKKML